MLRQLSEAPAYEPAGDRSHLRLVVRESACPYDAADGRRMPPEAVAPDTRAPLAERTLVFMRSVYKAKGELHLHFINSLRLMRDCGLYDSVGYRTFRQFVMREFRLARSTALEYIRVGQALDHLLLLKLAYIEAKVSWEQIRAITRVATPETEEAWIEVAIGSSVEHILAEVREAQRRGKNAPRDRKHGLPNVMTRIVISLTVEEKERVDAAFALVSEGPAVDLSGGIKRGYRHNADDARGTLVRWTDGILSGAIPAWPVAPAADNGKGTATALRHTPAQTVLYRTCPTCRESFLETDKGPVAITPERVDAVAAEAEKVVIKPEEEEPGEPLPPGETDPPNSPGLSRQVFHRDGLRCNNPGCGQREGLHAHHVQFRSNGGRTELDNLVTVCRNCHALIHKGFLAVTGTAKTGFRWQPHPNIEDNTSTDVEAIMAELRAAAAKIPPPPAVPQDMALPGQYVPRPDLPPHPDHRQFEEHVACLAKMGCSREEAEERVRWAFHMLVDRLKAEAGPDGTFEPPDENSILYYAIRGKE